MNKALNNMDNKWDIIISYVKICPTFAYIEALVPIWGCFWGVFVSPRPTVFEVSYVKR